LRDLAFSARSSRLFSISLFLLPVVFGFSHHALPSSDDFGSVAPLLTPRPLSDSSLIVARQFVPFFTCDTIPARRTPTPLLPPAYTPSLAAPSTTPRYLLRFVLQSYKLRAVLLPSLLLESCPAFALCPPPISSCHQGSNRSLARGSVYFLEMWRNGLISCRGWDAPKCRSRFFGY